MMNRILQALIAGAAALVSLPGLAASADELIQACEKLKRADDRATCLREAVRAVAAPQSGSKASNQQELAMAAAEEAMKALRRLASAATVGINLRDYSQLVVTESANVDEALRRVPEGPFRDAVLRSRQAYIDAREVWSASITWHYASVFRQAIAPTLHRYSINTSVLDDGRTSNMSDIPISIFLSPIWTAARAEATAADAAIASLAEPPQPAAAAPQPAAAPRSSSIADQPIVEDVQSEPPPIVRRKATATDQRALVALKRIDEAADTGPGFAEYARVINAGIADVDEALRDMPDDVFRTNIVAARQAYIDAREVWSLSDQHQYLSQFADAARPTLRRYGVGPVELNVARVKEMRLMPKHLFLFPIWQAARQRIDEAEGSLLTGDAPKAMQPSPLPPKNEVRRK
jgi:hypothetical protein